MEKSVVILMSAVLPEPWSRENNLDPEDDLNLSSDDATLNVRYKERIVIRECYNSGKVEGKKECAGGIVGEMTLGSIISSMNTGSISGDEDKVGGIAGESKGTIRKSSSKCALSGDNQIGGIAGKGKTITDCYSMIEIQEGNYYLGSIAGQIDDSGTVENNYFVEGCPPRELTESALRVRHSLPLMMSSWSFRIFRIHSAQFI